MSRPLADTAGAAAYLHTTERHVRELKRRGALPFVQVGRLIRYNLDDLDQWIEANSIGARS